MFLKVRQLLSQVTENEEIEQEVKSDIYAM